MKWEIDENHHNVILADGGRLIGVFMDASQAKLAVQAINNMPRNPHLPLPPVDGLHKLSSGATDIGGNYRCVLCGAYQDSVEYDRSCLGEYKESGKMRAWAQGRWDKDLETGMAFKVEDGG